MASDEQPNASPEDVYDAILMDMVTGHPHLSQTQEVDLKTLLMQIAAKIEKGGEDTDTLRQLYRAIESRIK